MPKQPRSFRATAIVLRQKEVGEADRILTMYSREKGKISTIAKGVRKIRSRKAGHLEPFTLVSLQLASGRDLYIISQAEAMNMFTPLREDLTLMGYASYVVELVDKFTYDGEENSAIFRLLKDTFIRISEEHDPEVVSRFFEVRLLDQAGFRPELQNCVVCEEEIIAQDQFFSAELGGVVCPDCRNKVDGIRPVSMDALRFLRHFQRSAYGMARKANMQSKNQRELETLMQHYITYILERKLNTPAFLRKVRSTKTENE